MIQQEINLNLIPSSEPVVVHCNQYDEGKSRIIAHLYNGSHPYTPGANATVKVQGTKPDNHAFQYWCDISGSTVTVDVNVQMTAVAGRTPTQLIVNETSGVTGSFAFYLDVQASTLPPDIDVSETDLPILTEEAQEAARRAVQAAGAAEDSADRAASWSSNPPYIGANDNWFVYDINTEQFVDSGILARGTDGEDGERGSLWYRGTAVSGKSADPTVFPTGIADALPGDMYLNVTEGAIYHCVTGGSASVATWAYDCTLTGGGGGGGTDNYNDLINQPKINNVTLAGNKTADDLGINSGIMLSSIMHIGGETQRTVQEALEALKDNGGGLYPYLYIDSEAGATVTVTAPDGSTIIPTPAGSGHWECELPAYGVYVIHSVLSGQGDATYSLTVDDVKEYHITDSHYDFTIKVIADAGSTIRVSAGTEVYTGTGTGSAVAFVVHQPSMVYTIEETLDGHTDTETVTSASTSGGSVTVTVHVFEAILNISTTSASLFGKSISIMKGGVSVGSTAFNSSGQATYAVHETGIYTLTCDGYTGSATVTTETTYPVSILAGLDLASWISAGSTTEHPLNPSSYADFAALEADEEAIRQLMTVHASVDYLAQATAGDSLMESVINSDVCAKWINLRDYALDTLYANSDIASEMDTADKYGYGEWVEKGQVPVLSADNGKAIASSSGSGYEPWKAYDDNNTTLWTTPNKGSVTNIYIGYIFDKPIKISEVHVNFDTRWPLTACQYKIQGSNDTTTGADGTWDDLSDIGTSTTSDVVMVTSSIKYKAYRLFILSQTVDSTYSQGRVTTLQFYAYEPKGNVPIMTADNAPYGNVTPSTTYVSQYGWYAFDGNDNTEWVANGDSSPSLTYEFVNPIQPKKFKLRTRKVSSGQTYMNSVILYGSNDGVTFEPLTDSLDASSATAGTYEKEFNVSHEGYYKHLKLGITGGTNPSLYSLQFYGRELKPLVPVMSADNAPKGEVVYSSQYNNTDYAGYKAFGDESQTKAWLPTASDANPYIGYKGNAPFNIKMFGGRGVSSATNRNTITWKIYGSDTGDANDWHDLNQTFVFCPYITSKQFEELTMNGSYKCYKLEHVSHTTDGLTIGSGNMFYFYGMDYSEKEFAQDSNRLTIYDHGLSFVTFDEYLDSGSITYEPDQIYVVNLATNHSTKITTLVDYGTNKYSMQGITLGNKMIGVGDANAVYNTSMSSAIANAVLNTKYTNALDVSGISGENRATGVTLYGGEGTFTIAEWWLE